jgi:hypothetical protein
MVVTTPMVVVTRAMVMMHPPVMMVMHPATAMMVTVTAVMVLDGFDHRRHVDGHDHVGRDGCSLGRARRQQA